MVGTVHDLAMFLAEVAQTSDPIRVERLDLTCKERPNFVTASLIVTKVVATDTQKPNRSEKPELARLEP